MRWLRRPRLPLNWPTNSRWYLLLAASAVALVGGGVRAVLRPDGSGDRWFGALVLLLGLLLSSVLVAYLYRPVEPARHQRL